LGFRAPSFCDDNITKPSLLPQMSQDRDLSSSSTTMSATTENTDSPVQLSTQRNVAEVGEANSSTEYPLELNPSTLPEEATDVPSDDTLQFRPEHITTAERAVPSSQIARAMGFGALAAKLLAGTAVESISRAIGTTEGNGPAALSTNNSDVLAATLCRMRGAALKLGQMLSMSDDIPGPLGEALSRVRQSANPMPEKQVRHYASRDRCLSCVTAISLSSCFSLRCGGCCRVSWARRGGKGCRPSTPFPWRLHPWGR
jgi:hypothetical protein